MSREWANPLRTDGYRIVMVSDSHHGRRSFTETMLERAGKSLDRLAPVTDRFIHVGDSIHWASANDKTTQDNQVKAWLANRKTATGKPWDIIAGNHDMQSYGTPFPNRSGDVWAADLGVGARNKVIDTPICRLILVSPVFQGYDTGKPGHLPMELNATEIAWIKTQADAAPQGRAFVFFHVPLPSQYPSHMKDTAAQTMVENTPNIKAWISGHRHTSLESDQYAFLNHRADSRLIHHVNLPSFGGVTTGYTDDRWGQPVLSTHMTILPEGGIELRFRDHLQERWVPWYKTGKVTRLAAV